jgi:acyl-CoA synthetase (AMP-forming)/AMP-acid ligase II
MVPEEFVIREDLPRTSTGKTDRITLRAELGWR